MNDELMYTLFYNNYNNWQHLKHYLTNSKERNLLYEAVYEVTGLCLKFRDNMVKLCMCD